MQTSPSPGRPSAQRSVVNAAGVPELVPRGHTCPRAHVACTRAALTFRTLMLLSWGRRTGGRGPSPERPRSPGNTDAKPQTRRPNEPNAARCKGPEGHVDSPFESPVTPSMVTRTAPGGVPPARWEEEALRGHGPRARLSSPKPIEDSL